MDILLWAWIVGNGVLLALFAMLTRRLWHNQRFAVRGATLVAVGWIAIAIGFAFLSNGKPVAIGVEILRTASYFMGSVSLIFIAALHIHE